MNNMKCQRKAYFILPNTDIAPNTLIRVGQIVPSLREPHRPLFPPKTLSALSSTKFDFQLMLDKSQCIAAGLVAQFLSQIGSPISGGIGNETKTKAVTHWKFAALDTIYFEPNQEYIEGILEERTVKEALGKGGTTAVFVITGLKIARGASYTRCDEKTTKATAKAALDATALSGVPVSAGPELALHRAAKETESCSSCSDFVWAIRVRKTRVSFFSKRILSEEVYGGELSGYGDEIAKDLYAELEQSDEEGEKEVEEVELEDEDLGLHYTPKGFEKSIVVDEFGEECAVFW